MSEEIFSSVSKAFLEMWIYYSSLVSWLFHLTLALRMIFTKLTSSFWNGERTQQQLFTLKQPSTEQWLLLRCNLWMNASNTFTAC